MDKKWNIDVVSIIGLGLLVRLILFPHAEMVHADAMSRVNHAYEWLSNPHYIVSGVWGPMNNYFFGVSMWLFGGKIVGPQLLNILFAVGTAYPLYWFTKKLFKHRIGAILVATAYVFTPIVIRNSFQALPVIPFCFFLALTVYYINEFLSHKKTLYILLAGIAINFASGFRYEGWIISFLIGIILVLNKEYKALLQFGIVASIFPIAWMIGGWVEHGDFLYSLTYSSEWGVNEAEVVDGFGKIDRLNRILFFPFSLFVVLNPIVLFLLLIGLIKGFRKGNINKQQALWLIIPGSLLLIYTYKVVTGSLLLQHKYMPSIVVMLLPYLVLILLNHGKRAKILLVVGLIISIPFSMWFNTVDWKGKLSFVPSFSESLHNLLVLTYHETEVLPQLEDRSFPLMVDAYRASYQKNDGLIIDNLGWENTYHLAMHSYSTPFVTDVTLQSDPNQSALSSYIATRPNGLLVYNYLGRLSPLFDAFGNHIKLKNTNVVLQLTELRRSQGLVLFRYQIEDVPPLENVVGSVLDYPEDINFFIRKIKSDKFWLHSIKRQANDKGISLEEAIYDNAQYVISTQ